ncbi:MAG: nicotinamide-nucleotide amidohydrolase family protein [Bacteroidales bacterium]
MLSTYISEYIYSYKDESLQEVVFALLKAKGQSLSTAESCTGGYISHLITSIAGSSTVFKGGIVAYSNEIKQKILGVDAQILNAYGAVSEETVRAMAQGARQNLGSDFSIAVSGIAGPAGGSLEKPVGTVWIAVANEKETQSKCFTFGDNRERNIIRASCAALNMLRLMLLKTA